MSQSELGQLSSAPVSEALTWIKSGFRLYLDNFLIVFCASVICVILGVFSFTLLVGPLLAGLAGILLNLIDRDRTPAISDVFSKMNIFLETFLFAFSFSVGMYIVGRIAGAIPLGGILGFCIQAVGQVLCVLGVLLIVDKQTTVSETFSRVWQIFMANMPLILVLGILSSLLSVVGALLFMVGAFLTMPLFPATIAVMYRAVIQPRVTSDGATILETQIVGNS